MLELRFDSLADLIRTQCANSPEKVAFVGPHRSWTYREVDDQSSQLAAALAASGLKAGDPIACITKHGAHCALLLLASSKLGTILTSFNWRLAVPELNYVFGVIKPKFLLSDFFLSDTLAQVQKHGLDRCVHTDEPGASDTLAEYIAPHRPEPIHYRASLDDPILRLFSSGTTGNPKAIEISHRAILTQCAGWTTFFGYQEQETRHLNTLPTFHVSGVVNAMWMLFLGSRSIFQPQFEPEKYLATIALERITDIFVVPAMLRVLLDTSTFESTDLSTLRSVAYGGSPIDVPLLEQCLQRFNCAFLQVYGMTEAAGTITLLSGEDHDTTGPRRRLLRSVGRAAPHIEVRIVHPTTGLDCAEGELGELWARSLQNMIGYYGDRDATAAAFPLGRDAAGGWLRTGDAGFLQDGYVFLQDRIKDMIISGGENIYPAEVENVLSTHPSVTEVAVIGVPDKRWGETVKACIVRKANASNSAAEYIEFTRARLAHYKCPTSVEFVEALPRNPSGKILKRILRDQFR